jgi:hypothetical protein
MDIAYLYKQITALAAGTLLLLSLSLGGCATAGSSLMDARAEAPAPPKTGSYLPVEDLPTPREQPAMTTDERSKLQKELLAARDRQIAASKAQGAPFAEPGKP